MRGPLFGLEMKALATASGPAASPLSRSVLLRDAMRAARELLPHLERYNAPGIFLQNGMKLSVDRRTHLEICTPECSSPTELVRYALAGERILADLSRRMVETGRGVLGDVLVSTCCVDYRGQGARGGCHESYLYQKPLRASRLQLIPFLVSRVVFTGAGGFDSRFPGLGFLLSPRVRDLSAGCAGARRRRRSIYHLKDEPLAGEGYGRLHIVCGETNASSRATWLKVGSTALVVHALQAGYAPGCRARILHPSEAMRAIARDPECRVRIPVASGEEVTAVEIQMTYLRMVEAALADGSFTDGAIRDWAPSVCAWWRRVLDALEKAPETLDTVLDWRVKRALYAEWARTKGFSQDDVEGWNRAIEVLQREARAPRSPASWSASFAEAARPPPGRPLGPEALRKLESVLREWMLSIGDVERFLDLRESLFEADTRYGLVDGRGIHNELALQGVLDDSVEDVGDVAAAVETPPPSGRARVRGEVVRRLSPQRQDFRCDWNCVARLGDGDQGILEILDLSDPYAVGERWVKASGHPGELAPPPPPLRQETASVPSRGLRWYLESLRRGQPPTPPVA